MGASGRIKDWNHCSIACQRELLEISRMIRTSENLMTSI